MDPLLSKPEMEHLVEGWQQAVAARLGAAVIGLWLGWLAFRGLRGGRGGMLWKVTLGAIAGGLLLFAALPQQCVNFAVSIDYVTRVRLIALGISLLVLSITFEAVRKVRLHERYALLWLATATAMILAALFPRAVALLRALTGMSYAAALVSVVFVFVMLVLFHFSVSLSILRTRQDRLTQRLAILETRVERLEATSPDLAPLEQEDACSVPAESTA